LAATNTNLARAVEEKRFRPDLFYRLNVVRIELPPLRKRPEDIALLTASLVGRLAREHHLPEPMIDPGMIAAMQRYHWPGNVRELRNALESMLVLQQKSALTEVDLPEYIRNPGAHSQAAGLDLDMAEREAIERTLKLHNGDRTAAASALRISVRTLYRKIARYGLS
jgi:two-component system response regulator HydG